MRKQTAIAEVASSFAAAALAGPEDFPRTVSGKLDYSVRTTSPR